MATVKQNAAVVETKVVEVRQITYTLELSEEEARNLRALLYRGVGGGTLSALKLVNLSHELHGAGAVDLFRSFDQTAQVTPASVD